MRAAIVVLFLALAAGGGPARAEARRARKHAVYLELGGKGGLWGIGADTQVASWIAVGATGSFYVVDGERIASLSPYVAVSLLGRGHHRWFVHAGPQLFHLSTPSPVPEWSGTSSTGVAAELSTGWEYRRGILLRVFAMGAYGKDGFAPWLGASVGWTL